MKTLVVLIAGALLIGGAIESFKMAEAVKKRMTSNPPWYSVSMRDRQRSEYRRDLIMGWCFITVSAVGLVILQVAI